MFGIEETCGLSEWFVPSLMKLVSIMAYIYKDRSNSDENSRVWILQSYLFAA